MFNFDEVFEGGAKIKARKGRRPNSLMRTLHNRTDVLGLKISM